MKQTPKESSRLLTMARGPHPRATASRPARCDRLARVRRMRTIRAGRIRGAIRFTRPIARAA